MTLDPKIQPPEVVSIVAEMLGEYAMRLLTEQAGDESNFQLGDVLEAAKKQVNANPKFVAQHVKINGIFGYLCDDTKGFRLNLGFAHKEQTFLTRLIIKSTRDQSQEAEIELLIHAPIPAGAVMTPPAVS